MSRNDSRSNSSSNSGEGGPRRRWAGTSHATSEQGASSRAKGPGRLLIAVYGVFALAATARAAFQIATKFSEAPIAYLLSAVAAAVYVVATFSLARPGVRAYRVSLVAVSVELVGVVTVGLLSIFDAEAFPHDTVWSGFGRGYGYVPLVLPVLGFLWLRRNRPARA